MSDGRSAFLLDFGLRTVCRPRMPAGRQRPRTLKDWRPSSGACGTKSRQGWHPRPCNLAPAFLEYSSSASVRCADSGGHRMRVRTTAGLAAAAILAVASPSLPSATQSPFSRIVVFGQSLSDPGNAFALRGGTNTPPDYILDPLLVPGAPYARGGHHFSNGATWVEQFARSLGLAGSVRPAYQSSSDATNFAVAGARAREDGSNVNPSGPGRRVPAADGRRRASRRALRDRVWRQRYS